jgi:hypothetical protein
VILQLTRFMWHFRSLALLVCFAVYSPSAVQVLGVSDSHFLCWLAGYIALSMRWALTL